MAVGIAVATATSAHARSPAYSLGPLLPCPDGRTPAALPDAPAAATLRRAPPPLDIGLTERDPRLLLGNGPGSRTAARVIALRPRYIRVLIAWDRVQPRAGMRINWDAGPTGCPPPELRCKSSLGLRSMLQAIKHRQHTDGGWQIVAVPFWTPHWAVKRPVAKGCERAGTPDRTHPPRVAPYRHFLRALNALADKVGVKIDYLMPWNEPNHPAFLGPQRRICDPIAKPIAPAAYATLVRAAALERRPGQQLVVGALAGLDAPRTYGAAAPEFIEGLPQDVACMPGPFAQHVYIGGRGRRGGPPLRANPATAGAGSLIDEVDAALKLQGCPKQLWIAETGTFDRRCDSMAAALTAWAVDPRVDAAFQFTFRDAPAFPVGLVSSSLSRTYGSYRAWQAFASATAVPSDPCGSA